MLVAVAAASRAATGAGVEAESAGRVAALQRQWHAREQAPDRLERANVAGRIGARGLADRRLVDQRHIGDPVGSQAAVVQTGALGRLALGLAQGRVQHVLNQRRLAGP